MPSALAALWCRALDVRLAAPPHVGTGKSPATRLIAGGAKMTPKQSKPKIEPPRQSPPAAPLAKPASKRPPADPANVVEKNGVRIDLSTGVVANRGREARLDEPAVILVAQLARVMPALIDSSRSVAKIYGVGAVDGEERLRNLIRNANSVLENARLEIKSIPRAGNMLADLGP